MTDTEGQPASGAEARPQETPAVEAPRNDAEAAAQEAAAKESKAQEEAKPKQGEDKPKRNRTGEYINRLQTRIKTLEGDLQALKTKQPERAPEPTLDQYNFDAAAHAKATAEWAAKTAVEDYRFKQQQETAQQRIQEVTDAYTGKVAEFSAQHPDFAQKVSAIPYQLSDAAQFAIMTHESGPEIAYLLANDDDLAFQLASIQPHLAAAAVERIASRMTAAPQVPQPTTPIRPVSQAPAPVPTVSGKTPSQTPPEKLTDDEWFARKRKR